MDQVPYSAQAIRKAIEQEDSNLEGFEQGMRAERRRKVEYAELVVTHQAFVDGSGPKPRPHFELDALKAEQERIESNLESIELALTQTERRRRTYKEMLSQVEEAGG